MGRPRKAPPTEPLPDRLNGEHAHSEPSVPTQAMVNETNDETIARMNAESRERMAEEAPIVEGATTADHPNFLPGLAPVHYPELDILATARHQAMQARQAASKVEHEANEALIAKMKTLKRTAYTSADGLIVVVSAKEKVTTKHDSGQKTNHTDGINNDPNAESLNELDGDEEAA